MFNKYELEGLLVNVGSNIEKPIKIYMIGGCVCSQVTYVTPKLA